MDICVAIANLVTIDESVWALSRLVAYDDMSPVNFRLEKLHRMAAIIAYSYLASNSYT